MSKFLLTLHHPVSSAAAGGLDKTLLKKGRLLVTLSSNLKLRNFDLQEDTATGRPRWVYYIQAITMTPVMIIHGVGWLSCFSL